MRLFFALLPDVATREQLSSAAAQLDVASPAYRVAAGNFHVTLAFVGESADGDLALFRDMGASLELRSRGIELSCLEYWANSGAIVLAAKPDPHDLVSLTEPLRAAVASKILVRRAERRWRPHVTVARKVAQAPVLPMLSPISWRSRSFALLQSDTGGSRSIYTVVDSWSLLDER